jgi:hypothetical protein
MTGLNLPSKPYDEVKSEFIKERISERQFELDNHREYINDLIFLERVILDEIKMNQCSGLKYKQVKNNHEEEYLKILEELDEEKYRKKLEQRANKTPSYVNTSVKKQQLQEAKDQWQKAQH